MDATCCIDIDRYIQGRRNSIISGETAKNNTRIRIFLTPLSVLEKFENAGVAGETEN